MDITGKAKEVGQQVGQQIDSALHPTQQQEQDKLDNEIQGYTTVSNGGLLTYFEGVTGALLALWNANLFLKTVPGEMGIFTAFVAVNLEIMAVYCVHNYPRSIGKHKEILGQHAIILGSFSLVHAVMAIVHYTGYGANIWFIEFYSNVLALPGIIVLVAVTFARLKMNHWSVIVIDKVAASRVDALKERADVLIEQGRLYSEAELAYMRAHNLAEKTQLEKNLLPVLRERIMTNEQRERMLQNVDDAGLRDELDQEFKLLFSRRMLPAPTQQPSQPAQADKSRRQQNPHPPYSITRGPVPFATNGELHDGTNGHPR